MPDRKTGFKRVRRERKLTSAEAARLRKLRNAEQPPKPAAKPHPDAIPLGEFYELGFALQELKQARTQQGKTLAEVEQATGLSVPQLSKLENGKLHNPTWATLARYAAALGKRLSLQVIDQGPSASAKTRRKSGARAR